MARDFEDPWDLLIWTLFLQVALLFHGLRPHARLALYRALTQASLEAGECAAQCSAADRARRSVEAGYRRHLAHGLYAVLALEAMSEAASASMVLAMAAAMERVGGRERWVSVRHIARPVPPFLDSG